MVAIRVQLSCKITVVNLYVPLHLQTFLFYLYLFICHSTSKVMNDGVLSKYVYVCIDICPTLLILLSVYIYFDHLYISGNCIYAAHFLFVTNLYVCDVCISRTYGVGVLNVCKEPLGLLGLCPPSCL